MCTESRLTEGLPGHAAIRQSPGPQQQTGLVGIRGGIEAEVGPLLRKSLLVLYRRFHSDHAGLEVAAVVDRAVALRRADFQDEYGLVRPTAYFHERPVGRRVHEYIVEHRRP